MPGALYNYINHGCGVQDFPVDRDGWSRRVESRGSSQSPTTQPLTTEPRIKQEKFKETPENSAPRMRTYAMYLEAKLKREQKKWDSAARVIQGHARKWLERNTIHILRRRLSDREEQLSMKKKENRELRKELHRVYRAVDPSKKALGLLTGLKRYQQVSGLVEKALSKKRSSRWGLTKEERLVVAQKAVNKKY
jgi:hypothetical protein